MPGSNVHVYTIGLLTGLLLWCNPAVYADTPPEPLDATTQVISAAEPQTAPGDNPKSGFWRAVKQGQSGYSAVRGPESTVLMQTSGETWRQARNDWIRTVGSAAMIATVLVLTVFYCWRGQVKLSEPRSGETLLRWSRFERWLHWYTAILFLILMVTGLSLLLGRPLLMPLVGQTVFAQYALLAKLLHNWLGPLFIAGLLSMAVIWFKDNLPNRLDIAWFKAFGGMVGDRHPSAERMNAGEKAWFWLLIGGGILVSVSGLVLDFPNFGQVRWLMQLSHVVHVVFAVLLIVGALGHIYIGTIGTEGALEGMTHGRVDASWAKQHHDRWYEEQAGKQESDS